MNITGHTKLTGLIGTPVAHSISPAMHNEAFRQLGLDYVYLAFDIKNEEFDAAIKGLKAIGIQGFNITMPYKLKIMDYVDELTPAAELANACNTVFIRDGKYVGHTTDGIGFMECVKDATVDIIGKKMTIFGAGGAATAIIAQAALDGVKEIDIFRRNRPEAFAETVRFADKINVKTNCKVNVYDMEDESYLKDSLDKSVLVVNATNLGMSPNIDLSPISEGSILPDGIAVGDIIYNPRKTKFYQIAENRGLTVFNGMYMLLYQGAASFQCWTSQVMPVDLIKQKYFT